jgi:hypothetical protein
MNKMSIKIYKLNDLKYIIVVYMVLRWGGYIKEYNNM